MSKHVALIFTPIDKRYKDALTHYAPSLGLIALENYLRKYSPNTRISIIDGSVSHTMDDIIHFLYKEKPDIVGQSIQQISYENALTIAWHAREVGCLNLFGGQHASQMAEAIVYNQNIVDYVCVGDGEETLLGLVQGRPIKEIPNLVFCRNNTIFKTDPFELQLEQVPQLDYSAVAFEPYQELLKETDFTNPNPITNYLRIYSHKGCGNRRNSVGCVFCGRADQGVRFKSPAQFWEDITVATTVHKADYIFDVGDDFLYDHDWVEQVAKIKPDIDHKFELGIFARANRVTPDACQHLKEIGVSDVVIGFESGDEQVLKLCNKRDTSPETSVYAAQVLAESGIDITASFVLGLPGENAQSLIKTIACAKNIVDIITQRLGRPPREMVGNLIEPSPGSPIHRRLLKAYPDKYYMKDHIPLEEMQRDYFKCYFGLDTLDSYRSFRRQLREAALEIHSLVSFSDAQGWLADEF
ncbi:B12-binding domain-containing radical SAM protein [Paenibacillus zanthoxyli]|uniref:B12-binding domain-containing radical SAM protein n=1 Tax=Paenibacillus zanthoxyli TaxID=369399 RepID=UPI00046E5B2B|nr:radical SAM protein [Paenibacillus zanthoxyli]